MILTDDPKKPIVDVIFESSFNNQEWLPSITSSQKVSVQDDLCVFGITNNGETRVIYPYVFVEVVEEEGPDTYHNGDGILLKEVAWPVF